MNAVRSFNERHGLAWLGALFLAITIFVMAAYYLGWAQEFFRDKGREVRAEFTHAPQLKAGDPVRVDGREEGKVMKVEDTGRGQGAIVTLDIADEAGPLYGNAAAQIRWKNLLGGSFYVEVDRGTPSGGQLGGVIPRDQNSVQVEVEDLTTVFRGDARKGLLTLPGEMSRGLADETSVAGLLDAVADGDADIEKGVGALRGEADGDLRRAIQGTAATVSALDAPRDELRALVSGAAATLRTTAARDAEIRATLADGPGVTRLVRSTLARLDTTLEGADGLVGELERSATDVAPTLRALRPTLRTTARLLDRARPLVRALRPTVSSLAELGTRGVPVIDALQPSIDRLDKEIFPYLSEIDPETGKPTSVMIGGTAAGFGGSASQQDSNGHFIRFPASVGLSSVYLPCRTAITDPTAGQILACDALDEVFTNYLQYGTPLTGNLTRTPAAKKGSK